MRRWLWKHRYVILGVVLFCLFIIEIPILGDWGVFGIRNKYIDLNSGKLRRQHIIWGITVSDRITDTEFSTLAQRYGLAQEPPLWLRIGHRGTGSGFTGGTIYGSMVSACGNAVMAFEFLDLPEEEKRAVVAKILRLMQMKDRDGVRAEDDRLWSLVDWN